MQKMMKIPFTIDYIPVSQASPARSGQSRPTALEGRETHSSFLSSSAHSHIHSIHSLFCAPKILLSLFSKNKQESLLAPPPLQILHSIIPGPDITESAVFPFPSPTQRGNRKPKGNWHPFGAVVKSHRNHHARLGIFESMGILDAKP